MRTFLVLLASLVTTAHAVPPPGIINHQGRIAADGVNINATGYFKFAIVNVRDSETLWTNDGTETGAPGGEPLASVAVPVVNGHYAAPLGDTTFHPGMDAPIPTSIFTHNDDRELRIWFSETGASKSFELLTPDLRLASVPYALTAATVSNNAIGSAQIQNDAVGTDALAPASVGSREITDRSINTIDLAPGSVGSNEIANKSIGTAHIGPNGVASSEIADNSVTADDLGPNSVGTSEIINGSINAADLAPASVTKGKVAAKTIASDEIIDGSVTIDDLAPASVGSAQIVDASIAGRDLASRSISQSHLNVNSVISATIADGGIFAVDLAKNTVTRDKIATGAVGSDQIDLNAVGADEIAKGSVGNDELVNNSITADKIADAAVGPAQLADNAVRGNHISSGTLRLGTRNIYIGDESDTDSPSIAFDRYVSGTIITADGVINTYSYRTLVWDESDEVFRFSHDVEANSFVNTSDRDAKTGFTAVDPSTVLDKLASLPITEWTYKDDPATVRHIGPVAQDFHAAFALGRNDKTINTIDSAGVALAAIKALKAENDALKAQVQQILKHLGNPDLTNTAN